METNDLSSDEQYMKRDFLISYVDHDLGWATWIGWQLEGAGYSVTMPDWDFRPGMNRIHELDKATKLAERILVVISNSYLSEIYKQQDWSVAFQRYVEKNEQVFFPVCVEKCEIEGLMGPITRVELIGLEDERAVQTLLDGVKGTRKKPLMAPRYPGRHTLLVGNLPDRNPAFVGRERALKMVYAALQRGAITAITQALSASSGSIGKTQIAVEYAYRYKFNYDTVLWLQATASSEHHYVNLESIQVLSEQLALLVTDRSNPEEHLIALKYWLQQHESWLLVIDNISDIALLELLLPSSHKEHILLTTRERSFASRAQLIELEDRAPEEEELAEKLSQLVKSALFGKDQKPIPLKPGRTTFGRNPANDYPIDNPTVSDFHAVIEQDAYVYYLIDTGSEHGTFVNEERLASGVRHRLRHQERIKLGSYLLAYGSIDEPIITISAPVSQVSPPSSEARPSTSESKQGSQASTESPPKQEKVGKKQAPLPRLNNAEQIIQQVQQGKSSETWQVWQPLPISTQNLPLPEPLLTTNILFIAFSLLSAIFFYLFLLAGGGSLTVLSLMITVAFTIVALISIAALIWVRWQQRRNLLDFADAKQALLVVTPTGFIGYTGISQEPMQAISFADLQLITLMQDERLKTAWLELDYYDGYHEKWELFAFFGSPIDICTKILTTFTEYVRANSPALKRQPHNVSFQTPKKPSFSQTVQNRIQKSKENLQNRANAAVFLGKKLVDSIAK